MTQASTQSIQLTEIDGVPTVWAACDGPLRARLTFRVGTADEQPLTRGVTHLVEHLALHGLERPGDHSNGHVDATTLNFHVHGEEERVVRHLATITRQLHALPTERLEPETGILRAEAARQERGGSSDQLLVWRYGATTYGLGTFDELGLGRLGPDDLHAWTGRFATRGNAVLMLTGAPPAGLRLHLPGGTHQLPPDPRDSVIPVKRTTIPGADGGVALHALVPRNWTARATGFVLRARLVDTLRGRLALSYAPGVAYERLTGDCAALFLAADILDGRVPEATRAFVRVLFDTVEASRTDGNEQYLEEYRAQLRQAAEDPQSVLGWLDHAGWEVLHQRDVTQPHDGLAATVAVDGAALAVTLQQIAESSLLRLPPSANMPSGWQSAPLSARPPVVGRTFEPRRKVAMALTLGDAGVTRTFTDGSVTVHFEDVVLAVVEEDRRALTGRDGSRVAVDASAWKDGHKVVAEIDRRVPADLVMSGTVEPTPLPPKEPWTATARDVLLIILIVCFAVGLMVAAFWTGRPYLLLGLVAAIVVGVINRFE